MVLFFMVFLRCEPVLPRKFLVPMFCRCGTLIHMPLLASEDIRCIRCTQTMSNVKPPLIITTKKFTREKERVQAQIQGAKIKMKCPNCGKDELLYNTAQLRSADEGQTVFYSCGCGYKETVNS